MSVTFLLKNIFNWVKVFFIFFYKLVAILQPNERLQEHNKANEKITLIGLSFIFISYTFFVVLTYIIFLKIEVKEPIVNYFIPFISIDFLMVVIGKKSVFTNLC